MPITSPVPMPPAQVAWTDLLAPAVALDNADAETLAHVEVEVPAETVTPDETTVEPEAPARPLCHFCGPDYTVTPVPVSASPVALAIDGCECPGCEALRGTDTPVVEIDPATYLTTITLTANASLLQSGETQTWTVCQSCAAAARMAADWTRRCSFCSTSLMRGENTELTTGNSGSSAEIVAQARGMQSAWRGSNGRRYNQIDIAVAPAEVGRYRPTRLGLVSSDVLYGVEGEDAPVTVCQPCSDQVMFCEDCEVPLRPGSEYYCDSCDLGSLCRSCQRSEHSHGDSGSSLDNARHTFRARATISTALDQPGRPGGTIRSTRALGVEIETARGTAQVVVDAEAAGVVPVLAQLGSDGSVNGRGAVEFRLLPMRGMWAEYALRSMNEWCRTAGYAPDETAGVHMHVDFSDLSGSEAYRATAMLVSLDDVHFSHAASDRRHSTYCVPFAPEDRASVITSCLTNAGTARRFDYTATSGHSRYRSVNTHAYDGHRTVEIRVFDTDHSLGSIERYIDAGAIIAGAVDFARTPAFDDLLAANPGLANADQSLAAMAAAGVITSETALRAIARLRVGHYLRTAA